MMKQPSKRMVLDLVRCYNLRFIAHREMRSLLCMWIIILITGVYPNPSKGIFTLTMSYWPEKMQIHLMDTKGRIIAVFTPGIKANGSAYQFNLDHLQKGVYFLKLVDNGIIEIKKIVIN
ncbi:MAG: hypothetical protein B6I19_10010 [Bacteroidetes bacterium 4572_114]|nr:MAG: hypothetical protein B6I19_10010 [Bacteroidetes bacterium 4572_114]